MVKRGLLILLIMFSVGTIETFSQDRWTHIDYSTSNTGSNGLIGQWVTCIFKDHSGKIWFGTPNGISVWDGSTWKSYTALDGLYLNEIGSIVEDDENNIWVGYGSYICGISKFDGNTWEHLNTSNSGLINDKVNSIFKDNLGNLWFATNGGISKYKNSIWINYSTTEGLPTLIITKIVQDQNRNFLIGTQDKGLLKFDGNQFTSFSWESNPRAFVNDVFADSKGNIWVGGYGLHRYNGTWETINPFPEDVYGYVNDIDEDSKGNLYFATTEGLSQLTGEVWSYHTKSNGIPDNDVRSLFTNDNDKIIIGTTDGVGIYEENKWSKIQTSNGGLINNEVKFIFKDKNKNIWFCTSGGISRYRDFAWESYREIPGGDKIEWVYCGLEDRHGKLWFGTVHGILMLDAEGWHLYKKDQGWIMNIVEDRSGNLWFTTLGDGVYRFDGASWSAIKEVDGLLSNNTDGLLMDSKGDILIGTSKGVSKWDGHKFINSPIDETLIVSSIISLTENKKGDIFASTYNGLFSLSNNAWSRVLNSPVCWFFDSYIDNNDVIWFGTINGLYKFDGENWTNYTTNDGLVSNIINNVYREKINGIFWFGTENGVSTLTPDILANVIDSPSKTNKSNSNYSIHLQTIGITQPFQFSLNGISYEKNGGVFENLTAGNYTAYVTNAYDTIKIENIKLGEPTSIDPQVLFYDINIFPNPSNGVFHFKDLNGRIEIFSIQGQKLIERNISSDDSSIDLSSFSNGLYIVKYNDKRGYLIKQ